MPDHRRLLLISVLVLTALLFVEYFLLHQYLFLYEYLPTHIPGTPINITGLYLLLCFGGVFYVVFKRILKEDETISMWYLIVFGLLIALFSEAIFQFYKQFMLEEMADEDRWYMFLKGVVGLPVIASIIAFSIAFDLKYKKYRWLSSLIAVGLMFSLKYAAEYLGFV